MDVIKNGTHNITNSNNTNSNNKTFNLNLFLNETCKDAMNITDFVKEIHPDCVKASSKFSDQYNKLIVESMGGSGDNDYEKENKIIKNIASQVIINKDKYSNNIV